MTKERVEQLVSEMPDKYCPRCGREIVGYPALSRYANVNICSDCGTEEAMNDFFGNKEGNSLDKWCM